MQHEPVPGVFELLTPELLCELTAALVEATATARPLFPRIMTIRRTWPRTPLGARVRIAIGLHEACCEFCDALGVADIASPIDLQIRRRASKDFWCDPLRPRGSVWDELS